MSYRKYFCKHCGEEIYYEDYMPSDMPEGLWLHRFSDGSCAQRCPGKRTSACPR